MLFPTKKILQNDYSLEIFFGLDGVKWCFSCLAVDGKDHAFWYNRKEVKISQSIKGSFGFGWIDDNINFSLRIWTLCSKDLSQ